MIQMNKILKYILLIATLIYIPLEAWPHQDFDIFLLAAKDFISGGNIFSHSYENGFHFFYSPLFALLLQPFVHMPIYPARIIWLILNIFAMKRCFNLILTYFDLQDFPEKTKLLFKISTLAFSAKFILDNFHNGQVTIFILLLILEGLRLIEGNKICTGSMLIALGINIKFLPLMVLPLLFYNRRLKSLFYITGYYLILLVIPAAVVGWHQNNILLQQWMIEINPMNHRHLIDTDETTLSGLSTLLPTLLMDKVPDFYALDLKRNLCNIPELWVGRCLQIIRILLLLGTLLILRRPPFSNPASREKALLELSYILLLIPLLFPHQQQYAFLFMFPASVFMLHRLFRRYLQNNSAPFLFIFSLISIFLLTNAHLILGTYRKYYDHFKICTYGGLWMLILLFFSSQKLPANPISEKKKVD